MKKLYYVVVHFKDQIVGHSFGPFESRAKAEQCLVEVARREDVESGFLREDETEED